MLPGLNPPTFWLEDIASQSSFGDQAGILSGWSSPVGGTSPLLQHSPGSSPLFGAMSSKLENFTFGTPESGGGNSSLLSYGGFEQHVQSAPVSPNLEEYSTPPRYVPINGHRHHHSATEPSTLPGSFSRRRDSFGTEAAPNSRRNSTAHMGQLVSPSSNSGAEMLRSPRAFHRRAHSTPYIRLTPDHERSLMMGRHAPVALHRSSSSVSSLSPSPAALYGSTSSAAPLNAPTQPLTINTRIGHVNSRLMTSSSSQSLSSLASARLTSAHGEEHTPDSDSSAVIKEIVTTPKTRDASELKRKHPQKFECSICQGKFTTKNKRDSESLKLAPGWPTKGGSRWLLISFGFGMS
jgi:hypothetical protein